MQDIKHTFTLYPADKCIQRLFAEQCRLTPDTVALQFNDKQYTYHQLDQWSNTIAANLYSKGIRKGQFVGICTNRSAETIAGIIGILKTGAAYVPFDPAYPDALLNFMIADTSVKLILTQLPLEERLKDKNLQLVFLDEINLTDEPFTVIDTQPSDVCYVIYTSGSTGQPKGVIVPHRGVVRLVKDTNFLLINEDDVFMQLSNTSFDASTLELWGPLLNGAKLVINPQQTPSLDELAATLVDYKITVLWLTAGLFNLMVDHQLSSLKGLRKLLAGGDVLSVVHVKKALAEIGSGVLINGYGPTENTTFTCCYPIDSEKKITSSVPIGLPVANTTVYVVDENLRKVNNGLIGELITGGEGLALGYLNRPDLTSEKFIDNPFESGSKVYRTGDLVRVREDGMIEFFGRKDTQVKIRGFRIELGEIENTLAKLEQVQQVCVIAREDKPGDKRLVAYIVPANKNEIKIEALRDYLKTHLADHMMPAVFVILDNLPLTPNGKIDRAALPVPEKKRPEVASHYIAPSTEIELQLEKIWIEILSLESVGVDDNFFDLGGNSLLAMQCVTNIKKLKPEFTVVNFFQYPTIAQQAAFIDNNENRKVIKSNPKKDTQQEQNILHQNRVAIIGMGLRFPGADTVDEFWNNLIDNKETVTFFKPDELDSHIPAEIKNDANYVAARGIINDTENFDAAFFGFSPREAEMMDPQHRKFLEVCWEAMDNAGCDPNRYNGLIGVFAGMAYNTYYPNNLAGYKDKIESLGEYQTRYLNDKDYVAIRVSHKLNLHGPSISMSTACSTSLVAITQAVRSINAGECDMAIAGGVAINIPFKSGHIYQEGSMFSVDGHTRTFDASAMGTVFSDGAGALVLKRYEDAVADGDCIYGVIRGVSVNNDGGNKSSFSAPTVEGQHAVIAAALHDADVKAEQISYVEAHGTATPLGDPIEVEAITRAFRESTNKTNFCGIGSVKSNIGHLTIAAGAAGMMKVALALKNKILPASLNYIKPNEQIDFDKTPFYVVDKNTELKPDSNLIFGVSAFGVGGTNAHVVVEEAPELTDSESNRPMNVLLLSAKTQSALDAMCANLATHFSKAKAKNPDADASNKYLTNAAYTLQTGRKEFAYRKFVVANSMDDALSTLQKPDVKKSAQRVLESTQPQVVFMFPGQGSQYVNMGLNLYETEPVFKNAVDQCCELLKPLLGEDLRKTIYPEAGDEAASEKSLKETFYTQPALFTIGYALTQLWKSWGIVPKALIGHSIGEFLAACIANIFTLEEALQLVAARARLMQNMPHGSMLSVRMPLAELEKILDSELSIAAINGPDLCVVSGNTNAIGHLQFELEKKEIACKLLHTSHAFHSPMMDAVIEPFAAICNKIDFRKPEIKIYSTVTSQPLTILEATDPMYWARHLRVTVRFAEAVQTAWSENKNFVMLECGPRATASTLARQQATDIKKQIAIASLGDTTENNNEWQSMMYAIGQLWLSGVSLDWNKFYSAESRLKVPLPSYPFERKRFWLEPLENSTQQFFNPVAPSIEMPKDFNSVFNQNYSENTSIINSEVIQETVMQSRQEIIIHELKEIIEDATGLEMNDMDNQTSFTEMGLDSLFLTQLAMNISKKYGVKITFRQLNENLATFETLSEFIDTKMPAEVTLHSATSISKPVQIIAAMNTQMPPAMQPAQNNMMQYFIMQQIQMLQQQLSMMGNMPQTVMQQPIAAPMPVFENLVPIAEEVKDKKPFGAIARIETKTSHELNESQIEWLKNFTIAYNEKTKESKDYTQRYRKVLADPRVVTGFKPVLKELTYQIIVDGSKGAHLFDLDGNQYIDILSGFGSNMFGHSAPFITSAIEEQLNSGYEVGPQHPLAAEVAELICEFTGFERAALCNTGSEAVLGCIRMARTVTNRSLIIMFTGSYHGIIDEVIARSTKKHKTFPAAAGILPEAVQNILVLDYGTDETLKYIREHANEIAAVLVEPIQSRRADFQPVEFLKEVRAITEQNGAALIFDEVITGFRLCPGGAQEYFGIRADIAAYGKVCGGGMPIGVMAGKREFMDSLDGGYWQFGDDSVPEIGVTYFAGTFVRHPFALVAAKASLLYMKEQGPQLQQTLNAKTSNMVNELNAFCAEKRVPFKWVSFASLFKIKYEHEYPFNELLFLLLRYKGIHIYDGFPCFLTIAHDDTDIRKIIDAHKSAIEELITAGFIPVTEPTTTQNDIPAATTSSNDANNPPVEGARLGKDQSGNPAWFIPDPDRPGKYLMVNQEIN